MTCSPQTVGLISDDLPPYLVRWLDLDHDARYRIEEILDDLPPSEANVQLVREFGLYFGTVSLVRKILGRHSGKPRGKITQDKIDHVIQLWRQENSPRGRRNRLTDGSAFVDHLGTLRSASDSEIFSRIGATVGLSRHTVRKILNDWNEHTPKPYKKLFRKLPEGMKDEILALLHTELTQQEIADKLNISRRTVVRVTKELGLTRDSPPIGSTDAGELRRRDVLDDLEGRERTAKRGFSQSERAHRRRRNGQ